MDTLFSLKGKRALVTGASSGIGYKLALGLAEYGAEVVGIARSKKKLESLKKEADKKNFSLKIKSLDILKKKELEKWLANEEAFSILINNAGTNVPQLALEATEENFDKMINLNVRATFFLAQKIAARLIKEKKRGSIVNISSQMGHISGIKRSVYSATKHAMEGFTKGMSIEWGKLGIRINTICPTFIKTPLTEPMFGDKKFMQSTIDSIPLGRLGELKELIGPTIFLASDASSLVTGSALMVDGGWTAR